MSLLLASAWLATLPVSPLQEIIAPEEAAAPREFVNAPVFPGAENGWPHWRGPNRTGAVAGEGPLEWSEESLAWSVPIPGRGFSTPILWEGKLFLTTAVPVEEAPVETGGDAPPEEFHKGGGQYPRQAFWVICLDAESGELLWQHKAHEALPHEGYHKTYGSFASIPAVTDGERLYASFGSFGVYAYSFDGEPLWSHDFEVQARMRRQFGEGAAPAIADGKLIFNFDQEEQSFAAALDAETGKELWRVERDEPSSWTTPLPLEDGLVAIAATNRVRAYHAKDGKLQWECGGLGLNAIPMPLVYEDHLLAMTGYKNAKLMAIRLGGEGDLTDTDAVLWGTTKDTAYTASPVLHEGIYYVVTDRGQISAFDAASGEAFYRTERLPRGSRLKASPIAVGDYLYVATEEGWVHLVPLGRSLEISYSNHLPEDMFIASPLAWQGRLYLRSVERLVCVK